MIYQTVFAYWIEDIREAGGISDCSKDIEDAFEAAKRLCYAEVESRGMKRNTVIDWAVGFVSAYMVSCVKNPESSIWEIFESRDDICDVFKAEAERNEGMIHDVLMKAAQAHPRVLRTGLLAISSHVRIAPTGSGKGIGTIRRLF